MMCVMCCHVHVMCTWLFRLAEGGGLIPVLISCQLRELIHLASWQYSKCDHVCVDGWVSLVTVCLRLLQEGTHTASQEGCWCGVVGGQLDGLW